METWKFCGNPIGMEAELVGSCGDEKSCEVPTKMNSFFCNASIAVHTPPVAKKNPTATSIKSHFHDNENSSTSFDTQELLVVHFH